MKIKTDIFDNAKDQVKAVKKLRELLNRNIWLFGLDDRNINIDNLTVLLRNRNIDCFPVTIYEECFMNNGLIVFNIFEQYPDPKKIAFLHELNKGQTFTIIGYNGDLRLINNTDNGKTIHGLNSIYATLNPNLHDHSTGTCFSIWLYNTKIFCQLTR